jgi:ceramide glucosyltransferase
MGNTFLAVSALLVWAAVFELMLWGTWFAHRRRKSPPPHLDAPYNLFPVSVIKPLKGIDPGLEANLEGFFELDYPDFELVFCVPSANDPAKPLVQRLIARHPQVRAHLLVGETIVGPNPKVNNLLKAYETAAHDWVVISDSNVRVRPDYLKRMVAHLEPGVGLVTSIVSGHGGKGFGAGLEAVYLNTFYARGMNLADFSGRACVVGKSMLLRRSVAARFGGMRALARYLAEDYVAGEAVKALGLRVVIASDPIEQVIGEHSLGSFWKRHVRWGRIRKTHAPLTFALEPLLGAVASGVLGAYGFATLVDLPMSTFLVFHLGLWSACDIFLMRRLGAPIKWSTPIAWFARELLALPQWLHVASGNTVEWRGQRLAIGPGGILERPECDLKKSSSPEARSSGARPQAAIK